MIFYKQKINNIEVISGSKVFINNLKTSLKALKDWDKSNFNLINKYLNIILIHPRLKNYNQMDSDNGIWIAGTGFFDGDYDIPYISSLLIHEVQHLIQFNSGRKNYGPKAEKEAYLQQRKFLKKIKYDYAVDWLDKQFKAKWWDSMDSNRDANNRSNKILEDYYAGNFKIKRLKTVKI